MERPSYSLSSIAAWVFFGLVFVLSCVYVVNEKERAILLRLGKIIDDSILPGLHFKVPLYHSVKKFDARILDLEIPSQRFLTLEKKALIVDSYIKWRVDPKGAAAHFTATHGDERVAAQLLSEIVGKRLRDEFASRTLQQAVSGEREQITAKLVKSLDAQVARLGVDIIDVQVKRIDLPPEVSQSVYQRMSTEREKIARDLRSKGAERAEAIRAAADRERTQIEAEAFRDAEKIKGEGDAKAATTYAAAYQKNPEFFRFYRSLQAYDHTFQGQDTFVLQPDSEFFDFFKSTQVK